MLATPNAACLGLVEVLRNEVSQASTSHDLRGDGHPDVVNALLPRCGHATLKKVDQLRKVLELDLTVAAADENAPSRVRRFIDLIDLEGYNFAAQGLDLGTALGSEDDVSSRQCVNDRYSRRTVIIVVDEAANALLAQQCETLIRFEAFKGSSGHVEMIPALNTPLMVSRDLRRR